MCFQKRILRQLAKLEFFTVLAVPSRASEEDDLTCICICREYPEESAIITATLGADSDGTVITFLSEAMSRFCDAPDFYDSHERFILVS